jgi:predicted ArsR family transcriptional regulator
MTEASTEADTRHGRPRPQDTIERDEKVAQLLSAEGPLTREEIATKLGITPSIAYMSLFRLRKSGDVAKATGEGVRPHTWAAAPK